MFCGVPVRGKVVCGAYSLIYAPQDGLWSVQTPQQKEQSFQFVAGFRVLHIFRSLKGKVGYETQI